ncbi:unnamed protein product, partial [Urochloa humidicola]
MDVERKEVEVDDDGRVRTGTVWTATTHAITAVIGSGVLALPWSVAQMGWVLGPIALIGCAYITYYTAVLLSDCYRTPDPSTANGTTPTWTPSVHASGLDMWWCAGSHSMPSSGERWWATPSPLPQAS